MRNLGAETVLVFIHNSSQDSQRRTFGALPMRTIACCLLLAASYSTAMAAEQGPCTVEGATAQVQIEVLNRLARSARATMPMLCGSSTPTRSFSRPRMSRVPF